MCVIPSVTIAGLLGEFSLLPAPPLITQSRSRSRRMWPDKPTSGPHNTIRLRGPKQVVYSLLLSHAIVGSTDS